MVVGKCEVFASLRSLNGWMDFLATRLTPAVVCRFTPVPPAAPNVRTALAVLLVGCPQLNVCRLTRGGVDRSIAIREIGLSQSSFCLSTLRSTFLPAMLYRSSPTPATARRRYCGRTSPLTNTILSPGRSQLYLVIHCQHLVFLTSLIWTGIHGIQVPKLDHIQSNTRRRQGKTRRWTSIWHP